MNIWTRDFWARTGTKAVKTTAQTAAATIIGAGTGLLDTDWIGVVSVSGMAGLLAVLMNLGNGTADPEPAA